MPDNLISVIVLTEVPRQTQQQLPPHHLISVNICNKLDTGGEQETMFDVSTDPDAPQVSSLLTVTNVVSEQCVRHNVMDTKSYLSAMPGYFAVRFNNISDISS